MPVTVAASEVEFESDIMHEMKKRVNPSSHKVSFAYLYYRQKGISGNTSMER